MSTPPRPARPGSAFRAHDVSPCPDDDGGTAQYYPLGYSPPTGQYVRVKFQGGGQAPSRFVIWSDEGTGIPRKYAAQISGNQPGLLGFTWPGGGFWYTFQHCYGGSWFDYRLTGSQDDESEDAQYSGRLDSLNPDDPGEPTSTANIEWGPNVTEIQDAPQYSFSFESIEILNTRSRDEDTNYATIGVKSDIGISGPVSRRLGDQDNGSHNVGLSVDHVPILRDAQPVNVVWSVVNSGHSDMTKVTNAIQTTAKQILEKVFGKGSIVAEIGSAIVSLGLTFLFANCDGPVVGGNETLTGSDLYNRTSTGDLVFQLDHSGTDSPTGCGSNSHYKSIVRIRRTKG